MSDPTLLKTIEALPILVGSRACSMVMVSDLLSSLHAQILYQFIVRALNEI